MGERKNKKAYFFLYLKRITPRSIFQNVYLHWSRLGRVHALVLAYDEDIKTGEASLLGTDIDA